jgi:hypothetical protein
MAAAGDEGDCLAGGRQARPEIAADPAASQHRDLHDFRRFVFIAWRPTIFQGEDP